MWTMMACVLKRTEEGEAFFEKARKSEKTKDLTNLNVYILRLIKYF
jgi:hypothetical protein